MGQGGLVLAVGCVRPQQKKGGGERNYAAFKTHRGKATITQHHTAARSPRGQLETFYGKTITTRVGEILSASVETGFVGVWRGTPLLINDVGADT